MVSGGEGGAVYLFLMLTQRVHYEPDCIQCQESAIKALSHVI